MAKNLLCKNVMVIYNSCRVGGKYTNFIFADFNFQLKLSFAGNNNFP